MPYIKVYIHFVWAVKNRQALLTKEIRPQVFAHIRENAQAKNIYLDSIGGWNEHIHFLCSMDAMQNIAGIMNAIKGESSFWINKNNITQSRFEWQDEYFAISCSPRDIEKVQRYIRRQEYHHAKKTYSQEYDEFIQQCGFERIDGKAL